MARFLRAAASLKRTLFLQPPVQSFRNGMLGASTQLCSFSSRGKRKSKSDGSDSGDENLPKKDLALKQALDQIQSTFGKGAIMWLGRSAPVQQVPVVSTGSFALDIALGIGGLPKGRVVEIYGPEASGKTTLALHVIAEAQKQTQGKYCAFIDAEHALDPALARTIGVNTDNLLLSQPDSGEQALTLVDTLIRSGSIDVVVVDSVAALVPKSELDGEMGDAHMAMQARLMSQALRKLSHSLSLSQTILIFINQVRAKLSLVGFGGPTEVTCGGNALKFYASMRLNIKRIGLVKKGDETIGSQVIVKIVKNKHAPPFRQAEFELEFGKGISRESEVIDLAVKHKLIKKNGGHYYLNDGSAIHGKEALKQYLVAKESVREELMVKLREKLINDGEREETDAEGVDDSDTTSDEGKAAEG